MQNAKSDDTTTPAKTPARRIPIIGEITEGDRMRLYPAGEAWLRRRGLLQPNT